MTTLQSLEDLLTEMEASGFRLFNLYEDLGPWTGLGRWNVRLKCPTSGLYTLGTADTPNEAFRIALDLGKKVDQWKPTLATQNSTSKTLAEPPKTLDDVLSFLPPPQTTGSATSDS